MKVKIYKITNLITNKIYIGSTTIKNNDRWSTHKSNLNANRHINGHLQNAWNKYGKENFKFEYIHECEVNNEEDIFFIEQEWLDKTNCYDHNIGYNICKTAGAPPIRCKSFKLKAPDGTIYEGTNLSQFCRDMNLDNNYRNGFSHIINGYNNMKTYKGWSLPNHNHTKDIIKDPNGNLHTIPWNGMSTFCKKYNLKLTEICSVLNKRQITHKGWTHPDTKYEDISNHCRNKKLINWR